MICTLGHCTVATCFAISHVTTPVGQKPLYSTSTELFPLAYWLLDRTIFLATVKRQASDDQAQFRQALREL